MASLLGAGVLVMIAADVVVGVRLVRLAMRTHRVPELAIAVSLLFLGGIGYPLAVAARNGAAATPEGTAALIAAALGFQDIGCAGMAVATVATFRPGVAWARGLAAAVCAVLLGSWLVELATHDFARPVGTSPQYFVGLGARVLPVVWSAAESWSYFARLRRRLRVGLGDAVVADRFRLWATSATATAFAFAVFLCGLLAGVEVATSAWVLVPTSVAGVVAGVTLWLAFLSPGWYLRRFQSTAAAR
jgi:hypothetical protein